MLLFVLFQYLDLIPCLLNQYKSFGTGTSTEISLENKSFIYCIIAKPMDNRKGSINFHMKEDGECYEGNQIYIPICQKA